MYKLLKNPFDEKIQNVLKTVDDKTTFVIPFDEDNTDYQEYLKWKAIDGNEPEAAD